MRSALSSTLIAACRVWHNGAWAGYRATFARFADQHFGVTTFCNLTTSGPDSLAMKVAAIYLGTQMKPDTAQAWVVSLAGTPMTSESADAARQHVGIWRNIEAGDVRRTTMRGDTLIVGFGNGTRLLPLGGGRYRLRTPGTEYTFNQTATPATLTLRSGGSAPVVYTRVAAATPTPAQLAEYTGEYTNAEIETTWAIAADSGKLMVRIRDRRVGAAWEPAYRDAFAVTGQLIDFTRDARGKINGFVLQSGRVRELRFTPK